MEVTCPVRQFTCDKYKCIPLSYRCDQEEDCVDGTDEAGCPRLCDPDQFYCFADDVCIDQSLVCNGNTTDGCSDSEEEIRCADIIRHQQMSSCDPGEFSCSDGSCVPAQFVCDGASDCDDGSDEVRANCSRTCRVGQRSCGGQRGQCVPDHVWCDGDQDCEEGSDEAECPLTSPACDPPSLLCDEARKCVKIEKLCDGTSDCYLGSDENQKELKCSSEYTFIFNQILNL